MMCPCDGNFSSPVTPSEISGPDISSAEDESAQRLDEDAITKHNRNNGERMESLTSVARPGTKRKRSTPMEPMECNCSCSEMIAIAFKWISGNRAASFRRRRDSGETLKKMFADLGKALCMPLDQLQMVINTETFAHNAVCAHDPFFSLNAVMRGLDKVSGGQEPLSLSVTLVYMNRHARS